MIHGCHTLIYSKRADQLRAVFRDVHGMKHVEVPGGWPIFALPPAEPAPTAIGLR